MGVVVAQGEYNFWAGDVECCSGRFGDPFGAAFYLALVRLEMRCCLWLGGVGRTPKRRSSALPKL